MKQSTEKIVRYLLILILMGIVICSMMKLVQKQASITTDNQQSTNLQISELEKLFILRKHTAFGIKVGFAKEKVYELFPNEMIRSINLFLEAKPTPAIEILLDSDPSLIVELVDEEVYRIRVLDFRFKTQEGIHIGSTLKELEQAYGDIIYVSGEGSIFATVRTIQMSFELDCADEVPLEWYKSHDRSLLDDNSKITKILVF